MIKSRLCDYSDAYILVKGTIKVPNAGTETGLITKQKSNI